MTKEEALAEVAKRIAACERCQYVPNQNPVPGEGNPFWDVEVDALWLAREFGNGIYLGRTAYNPQSEAPQALRIYGVGLAGACQNWTRLAA